MSSRRSYALLTSTALACVLSSATEAERPAKVLHEARMPAVSLTHFGYTEAELAAAAPYGLIDTEQPGIGSGLALLSGNRYLGITDRGPNIDHFPVNGSCAPTSSSSNGKTFPLPQFTPALVRFRASGGAISPEEVINLVTPQGIPVTGITNDASDDTPFADPCSNTPIPYNANGMDVEDLALLPAGLFLGVEENKPSVFVGEVATGIVRQRYTPLGKTLPGAGYAVADSLPEVLLARRANRGFEAVAVSADGRTAYAATQSPLGSNNATRVIRILRFDVSNPLLAELTGEFVWMMSPNTVFPQQSAGAPRSTRQQDLKLSAMAWLATDKLLLLERSDRAGAGGVRLIVADLTDATDITGGYDTLATGLSLENPAFDLAGAGITPAATQVVFEEFEFPGVNRLFSSYKLEGLAVRNANVVAIINDNDFGVDPENPHAPTKLWELRLADRLPLGR